MNCGFGLWCKNKLPIELNQKNEIGVGGFLILTKMANAR